MLSAFTLAQYQLSGSALVMSARPMPWLISRGLEVPGNMYVLQVPGAVEQSVDESVTVAYPTL